MAPAGGPLGLYIHFPYCLRLCPYCDFAVSVTRQIPQERYLRAVLEEWELRNEAVPQRPLVSIYLGGGTPSLWEPRWVGELLATLANRHGIDPSAEITLEANPERITQSQLEGYRAAGVNRLSLGAQSFSTRTLRSLGRAHEGAQVEAAFASARAAGFDNVTVDIIYGVHGQTHAEVSEDAARLVRLGSEHVSAYALTLDSDTLAVPVVLSRRLAKGEIQLPPDEDVVSMADQVAAACEAAGLRQYEISNFARDGKQSRHNRLYWDGEECVALGCGAVGLLRSPESGWARYANVRSAEAYLSQVEAKQLPEAEREKLGPLEWARERVMTGLRRVEGVRLQAVYEEAKVPWGNREEVLGRMEKEGLLSRDTGWVRLTARGRHLHSAISAELIP